HMHRLKHAQTYSGVHSCKYSSTKRCRQTEREGWGCREKERDNGERERERGETEREGERIERERGEKENGERERGEREREIREKEREERERERERKRCRKRKTGGSSLSLLAHGFNEVPTESC